jgi:hypothetical protein
LGETRELAHGLKVSLSGHWLVLLRGARRMGTDKNGLYDKEPSVMETRIGRFHRGDAHDKTECSARILVAQTASSKLVPGWDHGKEIRRPD